MATITIKEVIESLEKLAPPQYQEEYDNSGLITGQTSDEIKGILVSLDCTEAVVDEAVSKSCNLIIAHHPILFKGLKRLTGSTYVERVLIKAIRNQIAIYAIHTNLDNVIQGVNKKIADRLGLSNLQVLLPKQNTLSKLVTFVPPDYTTKVVNVLHEAGAGHIGNYSHCSFSVEGEGAFVPSEKAKPFAGEKGKPENAKEIRVEMIFPKLLLPKILTALRQSHPYEEVAYYVTDLTNENQEVGSGIIGELAAPEESLAFLKRLKTAMNTACIRYTNLSTRHIVKVAICGGAGSFLLPRAIAKGADVFVSADFKYHEFFDADNKITIADIGHYESEQFTKELIGDFLREKFPTFAIIFSNVVTNPISYL
ncbi:MAG: Nif3-like dinuclear metal center hexameric protein [Cyclobacteriaceae bacterium]|jgi:dinuclear metal center YbgI/SA1388 family protein|nr:Nif3-like dinuclear metal center hexameric protein [Cyclobacteriaceae bacterium]